jgi:uncharacterized protein
MTARAHLPIQVPIEVYGNGGFRFGGMSHRGSVLCLPSGIWEWPVGAMADLNPDHLADVFAAGNAVSLLLLGTGPTLVPAPRLLHEACKAANVWLEAMDTGAAARTYNVLLAEGRPVAAALIAVA